MVSWATALLPYPSSIPTTSCHSAGLSLETPLLTLPPFALIPSPSSPPIPAKPAPGLTDKGIRSLWHSDFDSGSAICLLQPSRKSIFGHTGQEEFLLLGLHPLKYEPGVGGDHLDMDSRPANRGGPLEQRLSHRLLTYQSTWIQACLNHFTHSLFSYTGPLLFKSIGVNIFLFNKRDNFHRWS